MLMQGVFSYLVALYFCHATELNRPKPRTHRHHLDPRHFRDNWFGDAPGDPFLQRGAFGLPCSVGEEEDDEHVDCASRNLEQSLCITKMMGVLTSACSYPPMPCGNGDCVNKRFQPCFAGSEYDYKVKKVVHTLDPYRVAKEICRNQRFNPFEMVRSFCCWTKDCRNRCYPQDVFGRLN